MPPIGELDVSQAQHLRAKSFVMEKGPFDCRQDDRIKGVVYGGKLYTGEDALKVLKDNSDGGSGGGVGLSG